MLQAENIRSARYSRVVLSKLLAARKANFFSARARKKIAVLGMLANARKDHSSPLLEHLFSKLTSLSFKPVSFQSRNF